ncbi:MAG TPA: NAD(P)-binding domain-containing protein [bacterium]|nr:NAD(P)-binding domain-containing protein [bacterium]
MGDSMDPAVAIIGAGPYGLSVAAYLRSGGVAFRIFGTPMHRWREQMPKGMFLKSEGCASNLFAPGAGPTLRQYCAAQGLPYADYGAPVSLETFTQYGLSFQQRAVPMVEDAMVTALERSSESFQVRLGSGETFRAGKVVVATGLSHTAHIPAVLAQLPPALRSHSGEHDDLSRFKGGDVTVVGAGQSALETAALLHEAGAEVRLLVRRPAVLWNPPPAARRRSLYARARHPMSNLGPGLGLWFYSNAPMAFYHLPEPIRIARAHKALGPAGAWWLRNRVEGRVPIVVGCSVGGAEPSGEGVLLHLTRSDGGIRRLTTDHVIAATGYRFALDSLPFLGERLRSQLRSVQRTPILSPNFESSVPGLYFTGLASANHFGPAMRFLHGADYTARRVSHHVAGGRRTRSSLPAGGRRALRCREFSYDRSP